MSHAADSKRTLECGEYECLPVDNARVAEIARAAASPLGRVALAAAVVVTGVLVIVAVSRGRDSTDSSEDLARKNHWQISIEAAKAIAAAESDAYETQRQYDRASKIALARYDNELDPHEDRHDGNVCEDEEEIHEGLCYKRCDLLSNGAYPVRCSAYSCGKAHPCLPHNQDAPTYIVGHGYDVNGHGGLPHAPGACLVNEEYFGGMCYKRCKLLTFGSYTHRFGPNVCCKNKGPQCWGLHHGEYLTSVAFDVGGGGDDTDASTPAYAHRPLPKLTEGKTHVPRSSHSAALEELKPQEEMHDGNTCEDNEEIHRSLCYKRCSLLTNGKYPIRNGPFKCCQSRPCGLANQLISGAPVAPCQAFDVNGHGGCPHAPGACLTDEEYWLGVCYKKCSILTEDAYPHRSSHIACCKSANVRHCAPPSDNVKVSDLFGVGGGSGDGHLSTPARVHRPMPALTEEGHNVHVSTLADAPRTKEQLIDRMSDPGQFADIADLETLEPDENTHDGNKCEDNEEIHLGLCYKKCTLLTDDAYPIRTGPFKCCSSRPCGYANQVLSGSSAAPCKAFDVNGHDGCPHAPGACLVDEELWLGLCYKKCEILTKGAYPHRSSHISCCKSEYIGQCLPTGDNVRTSNSFRIGGGGEDDSASTPARVHRPLLALTEAV